MADLELPEGWYLTSLDSVADWGSGGTPSRKEAAYYGGDIPWIKTGDLGPRILLESSEFITELGVRNSSAKVFSNGSVAIAMYGATIGKTSILGIDATTNQACGVGNPLDGVTFSEFLYYFLLNEKDNFIAKGKGGAQPNISQALIKEHEIPLPPLAEQKVIAEKLDTLLAQVETTKARLERIPLILKRFRQSVLAAAVSGRLTEAWRTEMGGDDLTSALLGDVIDGISQGWSPKCLSETASDNSWGIIKTSSVQEIEFLQNENKKLPVDFKARTELRIYPGDILTTRAGPRSRCGVTCYVQSINLKLMICDKVYRYRVNPEKGVSKYLALQLNDISALEKIGAFKTGISESGMNLTQSKFKDLPLIWPSIDEQTEIVRRVEQLFIIADAIEQKANTALERVNNLTQSILAKAFKGELTTHWRASNPDLISGENSAEALLKKIKFEREAQNSTGKKRRAGT